MESVRNYFSIIALTLLMPIAAAYAERGGGTSEEQKAFKIAAGADSEKDADYGFEKSDYIPQKISGIPTFWKQLQTYTYDKKRRKRYVGAYPYYLKIVRDSDPAASHSGTGSVRFELTKGRMALYREYLKPINPDYAYEISGWCRTEGMGPNSEARIIVEWFDKNKNPITLDKEVIAWLEKKGKKDHKHTAAPRNIWDFYDPLNNSYAHTSKPIRGTTSAIPGNVNGWVQWGRHLKALRINDIIPKSLRLKGLVPEPGYVRIMLHVKGDDVGAKIWFDDIKIKRRPKIIFETKRPGHMFNSARWRRANRGTEKTEKIVFGLEFHGLETQEQSEKKTPDDKTRPPAAPIRYRREVKVRDFYGRERVLVDDFIKGNEDNKNYDSLKLDIDQFGIFFVEISLYRGQEQVAYLRKKIGRLVPRHTRGEAREVFSITLDPYIVDTVKLMPLLEETGVYLAKMRMWHADFNPTTIHEKETAAENFLKAITEPAIGMKAVCLLYRPPETLRAEVKDYGGMMDIITKPSAVWEAYITKVISIFGSYNITAWQVGGGFDESFYETPALHTGLLQLREVLKRSPSSVVVLPAVLSKDVKPAVPVKEEKALSADFQVLSIPVGPSLTPTAFEKEVEALLAGTPTESDAKRWLVVRLKNLANGNEDLHRAQVLDLAKKVTLGKKLGMERISVDDFGETDSGLIDRNYAPNASYYAYRVLAKHLTDAKYLGQFHLGDDITNYVFRGTRHSVMVVWKNSPGRVTPELRDYFGRQGGVKRIDLMGNETILTFDEIQRKQKLAVDEYPVIVTGLDSDLALTRMNLQFTEEPLLSRYSLQKLGVRIKNQYNQPLTMVLSLAAPIGWKVRPKIQRIVVPKAATNITGGKVPGELEVQFNVRPSFIESEGDKLLTAHAEIRSPGAYNISVLRKKRVESELKVTLTSALEPDGRHVRIGSQIRWEPYELKDLVKDEKKYTEALAEIAPIDLKLSISSLAPGSGQTSLVDSVVPYPGTGGRNPVKYDSYRVALPENRRDWKVRVMLKETGTGDLFWNKELDLRDLQVAK